MRVTLHDLLIVEIIKIKMLLLGSGLVGPVRSGIYTIIHMQELFVRKSVRSGRSASRRDPQLPCFQTSVQEYRVLSRIGPS